ncbi:MAG: molybdopterin-dependent oxidoreductase [Proteobacteria bacterium]|nr:molybdopterin-dependent oxidoreductase [Pseudomonadota bacterium]HQR04129.1 molybdopterin-dependent oxidoreductase [Rhodocyclaceae bacterium]
MANREVRSFCRLCMSHCGVVLTVNEADRLVAVRGDRDDTQNLGYACFKGLQAPQTHDSPHRLLHPLKRQPDGSFVRIDLEQALDEVAEKVSAIVARDGAEAVAGYRGSQGVINSAASIMLPAWLRALGSPKFFTSATIDQTAKGIAIGRIGLWPPGRVPFAQADVFMVVGGNPLLSIAGNGIDIRNPSKRLRDARARGMKVIVIDPRETETARHADLFLQPRPGEDVAVIGGILKIILDEGWEDKTFCARHASQVEALGAALAFCTPEYVRARADVAPEQLRAAARLFAVECRRGPVSSGTGANMGPHSNLVEHLIECINVVCGRFLREGERIPNPGVLMPRWPRHAQVIPAPRWWDHGYKSRIGDYGLLDGEMMTGILPDEILEPGPGRVRALFNHGGSIASSVPGQRRVVAALKDLELLVSIEPFMTATAQLSHYIFPPRMQYERADLPMFVYENFIYPEPFTRYAEPVAAVPADSELVDDWYVFWSIAERMGTRIEYDGVPLATRPTTEGLLEIVARRSPASLAEIRSHPLGMAFPGLEAYALPPQPGHTGRFTLLPDDVAGELRAYAAEPVDHCDILADGSRASHRLIVRRTRDMYNSAGQFVPSIRARHPYNPASLHPDDLAALGVVAGERIEIRGNHGRLIAVAAADDTLRRGVVSISHAFGGLPDDEKTVSAGVNSNLLTSIEAGRQTINAMPRMTAVPVNIRRAS